MLMNLGRSAPGRPMLRQEGVVREQAIREEGDN